MPNTYSNIYPSARIIIEKIFCGYITFRGNVATVVILCITLVYDTGCLYNRDKRKKVEITYFYVRPKEKVSIYNLLVRKCLKVSEVIKNLIKKERR